MSVLHPQLSASSVCLSPGSVSKHTFALLPWKGCCPLILWACWPSGRGCGGFLLFRSSLTPKQTLCPGSWESQTFSVILSLPGVAKFCRYLWQVFLQECQFPASPLGVEGVFCFLFCFWFLPLSQSLVPWETQGLLPFFLQLLSAKKKGLGRASCLSCGGCFLFQTCITDGGFVWSPAQPLVLLEDLIKSEEEPAHGCKFPLCLQLLGILYFHVSAHEAFGNLLKLQLNSYLLAWYLVSPPLKFCHRSATAHLCVSLEGLSFLSVLGCPETLAL